MRVFVVCLAIAISSNGWAQDVESYTSFVVVGAFGRSKESWLTQTEIPAEEYFYGTFKRFLFFESTRCKRGIRFFERTVRAACGSEQGVAGSAEIAADRMEVKPWGGKRMIHNKNSNNARRNVRVEVEVLAD